MRVLLLANAYPPMVNSAARLFAELAEALAGRGHQVTVLTSVPDRYLAGSASRTSWRPYVRQWLNGVRVHRVGGPPFARRVPLMRGLEHFFVAFTYLLVGLLLGPKRAVIVYSPPLPLGLTGYLLARLWRGRVILNVQDLYPQTAIDLGLLRSRFLIALATRMEGFLYRRADAITVHSEGNREYIAKRGGGPHRVHVVANWVDLEAFRPGPLDNGFRAAQRVEGAFVVSYAGVMGFAQGLEDVVEAAALLQEQPDIVFFLVGEGVMKEKLRRRVQELGAGNVRFLPTVPPEEYAQLLAASDACLATLRKELATPVVPGKVQSIMAAGKPVLCSMNSQSDAVRLVQQVGCGICVEAGRPDVLAQAVLSLYRDRALGQEMGRKGRVYAEQHFQKERCISQYESLLPRVLPPADGPREAA